MPESWSVKTLPLSGHSPANTIGPLPPGSMNQRLQERPGIWTPRVAGLHPNPNTARPEWLMRMNSKLNTRAAAMRPFFMLLNQLRPSTSRSSDAPLDPRETSSPSVSNDQSLDRPSLAEAYGCSALSQIAYKSAPLPSDLIPGFVVLSVCKSPGSLDEDRYLVLQGRR